MCVRYIYFLFFVLDVCVLCVCWMCVCLLLQYLLVSRLGIKPKTPGWMVQAQPPAGLLIVLAVSHGLVTVLKMSQGPVNKSEELLFDKHKKGLLPLTLALNHVQSTPHAPPATASVNQSTSHEPRGPRVCLCWYELSVLAL